MLQRAVALMVPGSSPGSVQQLMITDDDHWLGKPPNYVY
jgi:hypothetical protein